MNILHRFDIYYTGTHLFLCNKICHWICDKRDILRNSCIRIIWIKCYLVVYISIKMIQPPFYPIQNWNWFRFWLKTYEIFKKCPFEIKMRLIYPFWLGKTRSDQRALASSNTKINRGCNRFYCWFVWLLYVIEIGFDRWNIHVVVQVQPWFHSNRLDERIHLIPLVGPKMDVEVEFAWFKSENMVLNAIL